MKKRERKRERRRGEGKLILLVGSTTYIPFYVHCCKFSRIARQGLITVSQRCNYIDLVLKFVFFNFVYEGTNLLTT